MDRVEILYDLLLVVCANETTKVWFQPSGRALQQFFQKGCPQLGRKFPQSGRKFPQPGRNFKKWRIVILLTVNILLIPLILMINQRGCWLPLRSV